MVLMADSIVRAVESVKKQKKSKIIILSPKGKQFTQKMAYDWSRQYSQLILISGRYEGIDERAKKILRAEEVSIGPYVMTDGDVGAMESLMKIGLFDHMQKHDHPSLSYTELYKNHLEILEFADQAGMDFYFVAEHHFDMGFSECPSPGAFLGAASQRTKRIRLGPLVYVLPLWNPIRVAEEVALLDNLTQGRLECAFGAGIGPFSFAAYNIPWDQKREMTLEALRIIKGICVPISRISAIRPAPETIRLDDNGIHPVRPVRVGRTGTVGSCEGLGRR